tara:strand:+ start:320 stop:439 length:120 start_codon:yes stop_codon:yes gene_type:complete
MQLNLRKELKQLKIKKALKRNLSKRKIYLSKIIKEKEKK